MNKTQISGSFSWLKTNELKTERLETERLDQVMLLRVICRLGLRQHEFSRERSPCARGDKRQ